MSIPRRNSLLSAIEDSARLSDKTREAYTLCVKRFLQFAGRDESKWTPLSVERWRELLRKQPGMGPGTINKHLQAIRYASKRLESLELGRDFAKNAEGLKEIKNRRTAMSQDEVRALFGTCDSSPYGIRDRCAMTLTLTTALRSENVVKARWENIKGRRIHVIQKGQRPHEPTLDDRTLLALDQWGDWLEHQRVARKGPIFRCIRMGTDDKYHAGPAIKNRVWFNQMLAKRSLLAGLTRQIHPHLFRHTCISWLLDAGVPPSRVMMQTGQASMKTLSGYVTDLRAESDPIGAYLPQF